MEIPVPSMMWLRANVSKNGAKINGSDSMKIRFFWYLDIW